jgi:SlyX protein
MSSDALEQVELKIAYLERANAELSDVVYRQQQEIEELHVRLKALAERVDSIKAGSTPYTAEQERPPHY